MNLRQAIPLQLGRFTATLPPSVDAKIWRCLRLSKKLPLWRLSGETNDGTIGTMISGGENPQAEYLPSRFFKGDFESESLGRISPAQLPDTLHQENRNASFTAVRLDRWLIKKRFDYNFFLVPEWIRSSMPVPESFEKLSNQHNSLRQDLRLIRKHQFSSRESHSEEDFDRFFETMYQPHNVSRHGSSAQVKSRKSAHYFFKHGVLIWILQGSREVAGVIMQFNGKAANFCAIGVLGGDAQLLKSGALAGAYYFGLEAARSRQCLKVDLGGTPPSFKDGLFRYKQKWGAVIEKRPKSAYDYVVGWHEASPAILAMLVKTPLIFREAKGFSGLIADAEEKNPEDHPPGIQKFVTVRAGISSREVLELQKAGG